MAVYVVPQFVIGGGAAGSVFGNNNTGALAADWTGLFRFAPFAPSGADFWRLFLDYSPGDEVPGGASPYYTSASTTAVSLVLSAPHNTAGLDYATLTLAITGGMDAGNYVLFYDHTFPDARYGSSRPNFCAVSDWSVSAPTTDIVQNSDGTVPVPLKFLFTTFGATVNNANLPFHRTSPMRYQAGSPSTDPQVSTAIIFANTGGAAPVSTPTYTFNATIVTGPTPMTITLDNTPPASTGGGTYTGLLIFKTATVTVTVYPPGTHLGGGGGPTPVAPPVALSSSLNVDAHRRPLAVLTGGTVAAPTLSAAYSNDAGHLFTAAALASGSDPSLLVNRRQNTYRIIYYSGTALTSAFGSIGDGYSPGAGSPAAVAGLTGKYPCAAQHPTDRDYCLLAYLDSTTLKTAYSMDAGATWTTLATVATGQDFSASGRPALAFLGERAFLVSGTGAALSLRVSLDRGLTWGAPATIATAPANSNYTAVSYSGLSLIGWQGTLYLLAWNYGTGTTLTPTLRVSGDLGANWALSPGTLPAITPPSSIGVLPALAQHRLGVTHNSLTDTLTWATD